MKLSGRVGSKKLWISTLGRRKMDMSHMTYAWMNHHPFQQLLSFLVAFMPKTKKREREERCSLCCAIRDDMSHLYWSRPFVVGYSGPDQSFQIIPTDTPLLFPHSFFLSFSSLILSDFWFLILIISQPLIWGCSCLFDVHQRGLVSSFYWSRRVYLRQTVAWAQRSNVFLLSYHK